MWSPGPQGASGETDLKGEDKVGFIFYTSITKNSDQKQIDVRMTLTEKTLTSLELKRVHSLRG